LVFVEQIECCGERVEVFRRVVWIRYKLLSTL
jgi:hypothetical protein